ncbi:MAG: hypothetical protein WCW01_04760 [Gammaproteobacteria bacterium]
MLKWAFLICTALGILLCFDPKLDFFGWIDEFDYYRQNTLASVFFISEILLLIAASYFLLKNELLPDVIKRFLAFWSENITSLYIVSWLLITWTAWATLGFNFITNPFFAIAVSILFVTASHCLIKRVPAINKIIKKVF